jgi:hypothetical protein
VTVQIYNCETVTIRPELVKRTKPDGVFYGLRLHMNTDQTITFWSGTMGGLVATVESLQTTLAHLPHEGASVPGQMSL